MVPEKDTSLLTNLLKVDEFQKYKMSVFIEINTSWRLGTEEFYTRVTCKTGFVFSFL